MRVAVCCITFRRETGLRRLLDGLNRLTFTRTAAPEVTVIVVDNDAASPMRRVIEAVRPAFRWPLVYGCEPVQGVASARNRCLDLLPAEADAAAFIDDDEVPAPEWLDELLHVRTAYAAPIVQGPVEPVFTGIPPDWAVAGGFFRHGPYEDGAPLHFAATNNSLIDCDVIRRLSLRFDPRFDRSGGEDQDFFGRAIRAGHRVATAERALVREWIPPERVRLRYLLGRRFRMGTTLSTIDRMQNRPVLLPIRVAKAVGRIGLGLAQCVAFLPRGRAGLTEAACNVAWGSGALAGLVGVTRREYGSPSLGQRSGAAS